LLLGLTVLKISRKIMLGKGHSLVARCG
jgi:hypothetical protein